MLVGRCADQDGMQIDSNICSQGFSIRGFLRQRGALLVHFNTPMSGHAIGFPEDIRNAMTARDQRLCFSTIQLGDRGPTQVCASGEASAGGSVGMVVDILDAGSVCSVSPFDGGAIGPENGGWFPSEDECARSINERTDSNEWFVQNFVPIGIFVFEPALVVVRARGGEVPISLDQVVEAFPEQRIFSAKETFVEWDKSTKSWIPVTYDDIVRP